MNLIPKKYPSAYGWLADDWEARTLGDPDTRWTILWSRETYGVDLYGWSGWNDWSGWLVWVSVEIGISETHPGVF